MFGIKHVAQTTMDRLGYRVSKKGNPPFPKLLNLPRYTPTHVDIGHSRFDITDAASFLASYNEIFVDKIYKFDTDIDIPTIIDCGANLGVSVMYFKSLYPNAILTAVEADPAIFSVLSDNINRANLGNVTLINRAVSGTHDDVLFNIEGADGGRVYAYDEAKATQRVQAITLDDLITGPVDFLKIDIEGAETAALAACSKLSKVKEAFIEYHSFSDDRQSLAEILSILSDAGFRYLIQTQHCSPRPFTEKLVHMNMDLQLNIFAIRK